MTSPTTRPGASTVAAFLAVAGLGGLNAIAVKRTVVELAPLWSAGLRFLLAGLLELLDLPNLLLQLCFAHHAATTVSLELVGQRLELRLDLLGTTVRLVDLRLVCGLALLGCSLEGVRIDANSFTVGYAALPVTLAVHDGHGGQPPCKLTELAR